MQQQVKMNADENQIIVYQPNETVRLDVRLENETVWLNLRRADACAPFGFGFRRIFPPKCFAFLRRISKMGMEVIPGLLDSIRKATSEPREYGKGKPKSRGIRNTY